MTSTLSSSSSIQKFKKYTYDPRPKKTNDMIETTTSKEQSETEDLIEKYFKVYRLAPEHNFKTIKLSRDFHILYLLNGLKGLPSAFESLDASQPWLIYWIVHALDMLNALDQIPIETIDKIVDYLGNQCQNRKSGGFGGGPYQLSHLAATYAAVNALCVINPYTSVKNSALDVIDRDLLYKFLLSLKDRESGGFHMHHSGELDIRGCYTALAVATLLNICTDELIDGVKRYVINSQTYEGGIGSYPGNEAHGGYAFCGLASLILIKNWEGLNLNEIIHWCASRQMSFEGGFQGRTNKLVDSCYSFWVGACFPLLQAIIAAEKSEMQRTELDINVFNHLQWKPLTETNKQETTSFDNFEFEELSSSSITNVSIEEVNEAENEEDPYPELQDTQWLFNQTALQEYLLLCSQLNNGGMRDKPGKSRDYYHTCYALSGLSIAQNNPNGKVTTIGPLENQLRPINPIIGICSDKCQMVLKYFGNREHI
jgi:protein farnesyltransferase subunit beta